MRLIKSITVLLVTSITAFVAIGCNQTGGLNKDRVIRVAHGQNEDHPQHKALLEFEKYVESNSIGLDVQIFPNELLGASSQTIELAQTGAVDLAIVGVGNLEAFNKAYSVLNLPYIMDSKKHYHTVMNDEKIMTPIYESTKNSGFIGLSWFDAGTRNIYTTKRVIEKPEDLNGLKIRVQTSPSNVKMLQALGASATPMSFGEVYTGLQQGVIDGAENNELALINNKHGEVAKNYTYNMHAMLPDILICNADLLDNLSQDQYDAIVKGAKYASTWEIDAWQTAANEAKKKAEDMGVKFLYPDILPFKKKMKQLHEEYTKDSESKKIYDLIRKKGDEIISLEHNKQ